MSKTVTHTVADGETIESISKMYFGDRRAIFHIRFANKKERDYFPQPGDELIIPSGKYLLAGIVGERRRVIIRLKKARDSAAFDRKFQIVDHEDESIHAFQWYRITTSNGVFEGVTDQDGFTENIATGDSEDQITIEILGA